MTHVRLLRHSEGVTCLPDVQPSMHFLRCPDYSAIAQPANVSFRVQVAQAGVSRRVGGFRSFGAGDSKVGKRLNGVWPGAIFGVREPYPAETPLSWSEVIFAQERDLL